MIICFSGTGNTALIARKLAALIGDDVMTLYADALLHPESTTIDAADRIVWAFPTYSWGVPPVMVRVINNIGLSPSACSARHLMLTTCGDDMGQTDRQWRRLLSRRGIIGGPAYVVQMPNTYVNMKGFDVDSPQVAAEKIARSDEAVGRIAALIEAGSSESVLIPGSFPWIKSRIIYPWFVRYAMSPRPFHATGGCTGCGACARACPMDNIEMHDGLPAWGAACAMCLRCYHQCPRRAVAYGKATEGKGQYICTEGLQ